MGLEFQVEDDKVCYTPLKDKCEVIQNFTQNIEADKSFFVAWSISSLHFYKI